VGAGALAELVDTGATLVELVSGTEDEAVLLGDAVSVYVMVYVAVLTYSCAPLVCVYVVVTTVFAVSGKDPAFNKLSSTESGSNGAKDELDVVAGGSEYGAGAGGGVELDVSTNAGLELVSIGAVPLIVTPCLLTCFGRTCS